MDAHNQLGSEVRRWGPTSYWAVFTVAHRPTPSLSLSLSLGSFISELVCPNVSGRRPNRYSREATVVDSWGTGTMDSAGPPSTWSSSPWISFLSVFLSFVRSCLTAVSSGAFFFLFSHSPIGIPIRAVGQRLSSGSAANPTRKQNAARE